MSAPTRNGLRQDPERWRETQRKAREKAAAKARAAVEVTRTGQRTVVRRSPLKPVSDRRRVENRQRRKNVEQAYGTSPLCFVAGCGRLADDAHELLSRARGGSITDPANIRPVCRTHHNWITTHPLEAERLGYALPSPSTEGHVA